MKNRTLKLSQLAGEVKRALLDRHTRQAFYIFAPLTLAVLLALAAIAVSTNQVKEAEETTLTLQQSTQLIVNETVKLHKEQQVLVEANREISALNRTLTAETITLTNEVENLTETISTLTEETTTLTNEIGKVEEQNKKLTADVARVGG